MVSINTNLSALIAQKNLLKATNMMNKALERLSTGKKINRASDNPANYTIASSMSTKISSWDVAYENVSQGMDMVSTASDTIDLIQEHATRIHNLITQAQNGTYDQASLNAINTEVQSRVDEIYRLYNAAEFNGITLFGNASLTVSQSRFMNENIQQTTPNTTVYSENDIINAVNNSETILGIEDAHGLCALMDYVNNGNDCSGLKFVLTDDVDLSGITMNSIGNSYQTPFSGIFDGQGHITSAGTAATIPTVNNANLKLQKNT